MEVIQEAMYVFILTMVQLCSVNSFITQSFKTYRFDKLIERYYEQSVKNSKTQCASVCLSSIDCFTFGFHRIRKDCYLYDHFPADCEMVSEDTGMLVYIPAEEDTKNVAIGKPTAMSSIKHNMSSCRGVDGDIWTHFHTQKVSLSWWCVDLLKSYDFTQITILNRDEATTVPGRLKGFEIGLSNTGSCDNSTFLTASWCYKDEQVIQIIYTITECNLSPNPHFGSRFVFVKLEKHPNKSLHFREFDVSVS